MCLILREESPFFLMSYLNISLFSLFSVIQLEILPATKFVAFLSIYLLNIKPPPVILFLKTTVAMIQSMFFADDAICLFKSIADNCCCMPAHMSVCAKLAPDFTT